MLGLWTFPSDEPCLLASGSHSSSGSVIHRFSFSSLFRSILKLVPVPTLLMGLKKQDRIPTIRLVNVLRLVIVLVEQDAFRTQKVLEHQHRCDF